MLELHKDALFYSIVEEIINGVDMAAWQEDRLLQDNIELCQNSDEK